MGRDDPTALDLGTLGGDDSQAFAINDNRQIVGTSEKYDGSWTAVLWQFNHDTNNPTGTGYWESNDLNNAVSNPDWHVFNAVGINNDGLILAYAQNAAGENHAVLLLNMAMAVDNNRDRHISFGQEDQATSQNPYRFWINDSREHDDDMTSDGADFQIPGLSSPNYANHRVNGASDLVNFFPVALNLSNALQFMPSSQGYEYHLVQDDSAVKFVYTCLRQDNAFEYLTNFIYGFGSNSNIWSVFADTIQVQTVPGTMLETNWLAQIQNYGGTGVILVEGSATTTKPLWLEIWRNGKLLGATSLYSSLSGVEQMFRHLNLCAYGNGAVSVPSRANVANEPQTKNANLVFLHGYNVNQQQARGVESEMFKRFYWSGSRARFYGVTWNGSQSQNPNSKYWQGYN